MKNRVKSILKASLIIFAIILFCSAIVWLLDRELNGIFKEWLVNRFIIDTHYRDGRIGVLFSGWAGLKQFVINVFFSFIFILAICTSIASYFYMRYRSGKDITFITDSISSFMKSNSDDLALPKKYSEIESQLIMIKAMTQKNQQLIQMETQRKNDLITYLAHDLKTPLASVIGYLSILDEAPDMPTEQKAKYVGIALDKAYRLEELINEFFEITRFNLQSIVLHKSKIKLAFMLRQMVDEFYPMLTPRRKQVVINAPEELTLWGDADKLARVFNNILKNAIVYSYDETIIEIFAVQQSENAVITFTNRGNPIPPQNLDTIFEKFYRLDISRSSTTGGAGLGLAIAKEIVCAHNGSITVQSDDAQTTFTLILPDTRKS